MPGSILMLSLKLMRTRTLLIVVLHVAALLAVAAPAAPQASGAADPELKLLQDSFVNLHRSLQVRGGIAEQDRAVVTSLRDRASEYRRRHADSTDAVALELQLSIWLEDDDRVDDLFGDLVRLQPGDAKVGAAWLTYFQRRDDQQRVDRVFRRLIKEFPGEVSFRVARAEVLRDKNRYGEAMEVLDPGKFDMTNEARAALVLSDCLFAEQRFQEAIDVLEALTQAARDRDPKAAQQIDIMLPMRKEYPALWDAELAVRSAEAAAADLPQAELITERGRIVVELFENEAPNTVANFIKLADDGFYDGTRFHRVLPNFMAQGGDPNSREGSDTPPGNGNPGYRIADEFDREGARKHFTGSLAMAHTGAPHSGGCQFYITVMPPAQLNGKYTVFGRVIEGLDVVRAIEPDDDLATVRVLRRRDHAYEPQTIPLAGPGDGTATSPDPHD